MTDVSTPREIGYLVDHAHRRTANATPTPDEIARVEAHQKAKAHRAAEEILEEIADRPEKAVMVYGHYMDESFSKKALVGAIMVTAYQADQNWRHRAVL